MLTVVVGGFTYLSVWLVGL